MIKKISLFIAIGIIITVFLAQFDPWIHNKLKKTCFDIAVQSLGCNATFVIESINVFSPCIILTDVEMIACDETWSWTCKKCTISSSWIQLLLKGIMDRHIIMERFNCSTIVFNDGTCSIEPHIIALNSQSLFPIPTDIKSITFKKSCLSLHNEQKSVIASLFFNSSSLKVGTRLKTMMSLFDGNITYANNTYGDGIFGEISLTTWHNNDIFMYTLNGSGVLHIPHMLDQGTCYVSGAVESGRGRLSIRNAYNSFIIDPIILTEREIKINGTIPLSYVIHCIKPDITYSINGNVHCVIRIEKTEGTVDGYLVVQDSFIENIPICDVAKILFDRKNQEWKLKLNLSRCNEEYKGTGYWEEKTDQGHFEFHNSTYLSSSFAPHWRIMPNHLMCSLFINDNEYISIYKLDALNLLSKAHHSLYGGFSYGFDTLFTINGMLDSTEFNIKTKTLPYIALDHCSFLDKDKKPFVFLQKSQSTKGYIMFSFIRNFINTFFHYDVQGEGSLIFDGDITSTSISADLSLEDATIRLPETYNFIDGLKTHITYDISKNFFTLHDMSISLHMGTIQCLRAIASFDNKGKLTFAHAPFLLHRCLFNIKKDLFAIISGNLLFLHNTKQNPCVSGNIIIERAQLKENIFSSVIQKQLFDHSIFSMPGIPIECDLSIETKSPIRVDTAFLQTNAKANLKIQNNITEPTVSGTITLQSGNLIFPYKPLLINKGILTFSSEHYLNPSIELSARNKIKKYDISLQIAGSLHNHHIILDSTPALSEEQIMTLLLVGSQESSLNNMIPALIVQNLKNLIFSNNQSTFLEKYFSPLLRPFNINLVPSFADQTGRGGLRGMLEVSINDRWKATIQKNFSLTEDTRIELEFLLSDDITLRGIRDERRDLGGEVEMKWKF